MRAQQSFREGRGGFQTRVIGSEERISPRCLLHLSVVKQNTKWQIQKSIELGNRPNAATKWRENLKRGCYVPSSEKEGFMGEEGERRIMRNSTIAW